MPTIKPLIICSRIRASIIVIVTQSSIKVIIEEPLPRIPNKYTNIYVPNDQKYSINKDIPYKTGKPHSEKPKITSKFSK